MILEEAELQVPGDRLAARRLLGPALVVLSTVAIALVPTLARFAYEGGSNALTVTAGRGLVSTVVLFVALRSTGRPVRLPRRLLPRAFGVGLAYAVMLLALLGAVERSPVSLVVLVFFTHPVLVSLWGALAGRARSGLRLTFASVVAVAGLAAAIGVDLDASDAVGLALAGLASLTCVVVILGSDRGTREAGALTFLLHVIACGTAALLTALSVAGPSAWPASVAGWTGFAGVAIAATVGSMAFFAALPMIGAVRATVISNLEPLLGILFAVLLLGETLSAAQAVGALFVLAAVAACSI